MLKLIGGGILASSRTAVFRKAELWVSRVSEISVRRGGDVGWTRYCKTAWGVNLFAKKGVEIETPTNSTTLHSDSNDSIVNIPRNFW